jgi:protein SCO1/2
MQERILGFVAIALALVIAGLALFWQPDVAERPLPRLPIVEGGISRCNRQAARSP